MKLSANQETALKRLREEYAVNPKAKFSAYELRTSLATLNALRSKGLIVRVDDGRGVGFYPRSCMFFRYVPVDKAVVKFRCIGSSCDGRTGRWEVDCPDCNRKVKPATTLFAHQTFACDCGIKFEADWNAPSVKVMK